MSDASDAAKQELPRQGCCAIIGEPNVGKSTFLNRVLDHTLAITAPIPGTTRVCLRGNWLQAEPPTSIAFLDTPGMAKPKHALDSYMLQQVYDGLAQSDVWLWIVATSSAYQAERAAKIAQSTLAQRIQKGNCPLVIAINKVDTLRDKSQLLPWIQFYQDTFNPIAVMPISARSGNGIDELLALLRNELPTVTKLDDDEALSNRPMRFFAAEIIREACLQQLRDELPYGIGVYIERYTQEDQRLHIAATLVVNKESHKRMVIGRQGQCIKSIGTQARKQLEGMAGQKVNLRVWVKVINEWVHDAARSAHIAEGDAP